jgi:phosphopantothenoylcysteine decarboxylase/phosphopantothenate--cysteine ligase
MKKRESGSVPDIKLAQNPDILATIGNGPKRPRLVIGFAAETDDVVANARAKLAKKNADWIVANDVSPATGIMGGDRNTVHLVSKNGVEDWPELDKREVGTRLAARIADVLKGEAA